MKVFVSGATGFIGTALVRRLVKEGSEVHALYRSKEKAGSIDIPGVSLFKGDILDPGSLDPAMKGCIRAYHTAAFASVWSPDPSLADRLNITGTLNVVGAAIRAGIRRMVVTSTAGVLGPSQDGPVHENSPSPDSFFTSYERSKYKLEQELKNYKSKEIEIVVVNPTRVFGPGVLSESNGVTRMIQSYIKYNWRYLPGNGNQYGNYAFIDDVVDGHILAMERGRDRERYVLGGENLTYRQLFQLVTEYSGIRKRLIGIPLWLMLASASFMLGRARITGKPPLIVPDLVRKFHHNWIVSSDKAVNEIGYRPLPAKEAVAITIDWINSLTQEANE